MSARRKSHCKHGHALTGANVGIRKNRKRFCRACKKLYPSRSRTYVVDHEEWRET